MTEAYPLQWPAGKPRTSRPERARFDVSQDRAQTGILQQIRMLGGKLPVISTNIPLRRDGLPYANRKVGDDKGVAVYFTLRSQQMCFACDRWDDIKDNMQAIHKTIEALRGIERWGSGDMVQQAFTGFLALPSQESPYDVLGVKPTASQEEIEAAYRQKARFAHPDAGGSTEAMQRLNDARQRLKSQAA